MHAHRYGSAFAHRGRWGGPYGRGPWGGPRGHGYWGGPWGSGPRGGILPYLAAAFLIRALMGRGHRGQRHRGRGPWGWDKGHGPHGPGRWGEGAPWWRGEWGRGYEPGPGRGAMRGLRSEIGPLVGLLRDAFRQGGLDPRQVNEIRAVLSEARGRIATIIAETHETHETHETRGPYAEL